MSAHVTTRLSLLLRIRDAANAEAWTRFVQIYAPMIHRFGIRRGLQDALGLGREDFGPNSGIVLFERGDALVERADRLEERGEVPLILIDASEQVVDIPVLQFPLWLAFAAGPGETDTIDDLL